MEVDDIAGAEYIGEWKNNVVTRAEMAHEPICPCCAHLGQQHHVLGLAWAVLLMEMEIGTSACGGHVSVRTVLHAETPNKSFLVAPTDG